VYPADGNVKRREEKRRASVELTPSYNICGEGVRTGFPSLFSVFLALPMPLKSPLAVQTSPLLIHLVHRDAEQ
jgi:hypothetical protein